MSKEAMKLALEALMRSRKAVSGDLDLAGCAYGSNDPDGHRYDDAKKALVTLDKAITALREALVEQPAKQDIPDLIAGALGVSRGTAYDLMREALAQERSSDEQPAQQELYPPPQCTRSHPHENMDAMCELRTEIARLTNENARLKAQPAPVQEPVAKTFGEENVELGVYSDDANDGQQRELVGEVEMGQLVGDGAHKSASNPDAKGEIAVIRGVDEYGPMLDWYEHWVNFPVGTKLYTTPPAAPVQEPVAYITPLMEQQMFDDWCPYKGSPDPRIVWAAAVEAVNGLLLGVTPPAAPVQEPKFVRMVDGVPCITLAEHKHLIATNQAAAQRQWVGLTTDEMKEVADRYHLKPPNVPVAFRAIEAKLREKNAAQPAVPLTDEQILALWEDTYVQRGSTGIEFARAIEAAHGIGEKK